MSGKISKEAAQYREGSAFTHCGNCDMYRDHSCTLVAGQISPSAVCRYWTPKRTVQR